MRKYGSLFVIVIFSWWLAGCTSQPLQTQLPADLRIGLVSLLGDNLRYQQLGTTIFTAQIGQAATPNLDMDVEVVSVLDRSLRTGGHYKTVDLQGTAPRLIKPYEGEGKSRNSYAFDADKSRKDLEWLKGHSDIDYLLVVSPGFHHSKYKRPQSYFKYGYYCSSFLGSKDAGVYLVARLSLVDMSSLQTAAWHDHVSFKEIDYLCTEKSYTDFDEKDKDYVSEALRNLVAESLSRSLEKLNILPPSLANYR